MGINLSLSYQNFNADSLMNVWSKMPVHDSVVAVKGNFLHTGGRLYEAHRPFLSGNVMVDPGQYWIFYLLVGFIALFAFIKYYFSRDLSTLMFSFGKNSTRQDNDAGGKISFLVTVFLFVNFLVSIGLLIVAADEKFHFFRTSELTLFHFFLISSSVVLAYYLFNEISAIVTGFLFGVSKQAFWYVKAGSNLFYMLGIVLLPLLLIYFFTGIEILFYLAVILVIITVLFKWVLLLRNSYSLNHFTAFHNILYLCALEIIPIMLLIKVSMGSI